MHLACLSFLSAEANESFTKDSFLLLDLGTYAGTYIQLHLQTYILHKLLYAIHSDIIIRIFVVQEITNISFLGFCREFLFGYHTYIF